MSGRQFKWDKQCEKECGSPDSLGLDLLQGCARRMPGVLSASASALFEVRGERLDFPATDWEHIAACYITFSFLFGDSGQRWVRQRFRKLSRMLQN